MLGLLGTSVEEGFVPVHSPIPDNASDRRQCVREIMGGGREARHVAAVFGNHGEDEPCAEGEPEGASPLRRCVLRRR